MHPPPRSATATIGEIGDFMKDMITRDNYILFDNVMKHN